MRWALALLFFAAPAHAAEYLHCYLRDGPVGAPTASDLGPNVSALFPNLQIATLKNACGLAGEGDRAMLMGIVEAGGCTEESEIAGYVRETFDMNTEAARAELGGDVPEEMMEALCAAARACDPRAAGYDDACLAGVAAAVGQR